MAVDNDRSERWAPHLPVRQLRFARPTGGLDAVVAPKPVAGQRSVVDPAELIRFRNGDPDAVRAVYRAHGASIFAVTYKTLGSRDLAEEAAQQTFVKAWRAAATFDPTRELGPWLATIARRTAIDLHRREARRLTQRLDDAAVVELPDGVHQILDVWAVREAVDELPPLEREVVRLQHLESLTQAEIGARLGVPVGTIKSRSFRAHRRLAARLGHLRGVE